MMCLCGHTDSGHKMGKGPCKLCDRFGCDGFTAADDEPQDVPTVEAVVEPAPADENIDGIADLLDAADHTGNAALGRAAEKIRALIRELQDQLAEHARDTRLRQEMAELEARLAEIREQLAAKPAQYSSAA